MHCYLEKDKPELFPISTKISALLYWKREDLTVLHPNRELWKQIDRTVINSKLKPLIRTQDSISCQQRTVTTKKKNGLSPNQTVHFQTSRYYFIPTENCDHQKRKNGLYPNHRELSIVSWKRQDWTVLHINKELCIVTLKKTRLNRSPSQ